MQDVIAADPSLARARGDREALYVALGHHQRRFYFFVSCITSVLSFDSRELCREGAALELVPDRDHWARLFPKAQGHWRPPSPDWVNVGTHLIAECYRAGEWEPSPGVRAAFSLPVPHMPTRYAGGHSMLTKVRRALEAEPRGAAARRSRTIM